MESLGFSPVAYAYPGGGGNLPSTKQALADAGFLSGRLHHPAHSRDPYIIPGNTLVPDDWYGLPTLVMADISDGPGMEQAINSTDELTHYLDEALTRRAWLISTYHNIGGEPGTGHYKMSEFITDLEAIKARSFWSASFNDATLYIMERAQAEVSMQRILDASGAIQELQLRIDDHSTDPRFIQPLTVMFPISEVWYGLDLGVYRDDLLQEVINFNSSKGKVSLPPDEQQYVIRPLSI